MVRFEKQRDSLLYLFIGLGTLATLWIDIITPLGMAEWILYFIPLGLCLYTWQPRMPILVAGAASALIIGGYYFSAVPSGFNLVIAQVNRSSGVVVVWVIAVIVRQAILNRLELKEQDWIKAGRRDITSRLEGEQSPKQLGDNILRFLCEYLGAPVGILYAREGQGDFRRMGAYALADGATQEILALGEGLPGQAVKDDRPLRLDDVPEGYFSVSSALGSAPPRHLVVIPTHADAEVNGVIEIGFHHPVGTSDMEMLASVAQPVGVAIRSAQYRARLELLLAQTQEQSAELQAQQEELRVSNEELEEHSRALRESQTRLEAQQAELEQTNAHLEEQAEMLERQRDHLAQTQGELTQKAEELARANRYKSEFLANMSHELRTPLNSVLILAKLLADNKDGNLTAEQVRFASTIYSAGNDLLALINDVLDLSRIEAGRLDVQPEKVDLGRTVTTLAHTFQPVAREKSLAFETHLDPGAPKAIETDPIRLQQILRNLLANALKFTETGEVSLSIAPRGSGLIAFAVRDTGVGIAEDQQDVIFEAFRQADGSTHRKHGGSGLGLSISRELARRLGGEIEVTSRLGAGSTFTLVLPIELAVPQPEAPAAAPRQTPQPKPAPQAAAPRPIAPAAGRSATSAVRPSAGPAAVQDDRDRLVPEGRSLLVIEDDPTFARIVYDLAHELGFNCLVAPTADEGVDLALHCRPSAVVLDMNLPDRSGLTVLEQLKRNATTRHIPVHVVSVEDHARQALEMGAIGYAVKPVGRDQLAEALRKLEGKLEQRVRRVLVVEDVEIQRQSIVHLLASEQVEITAVSTAAEALAQLKGTTFDCLVLDLSLPDMSGYELLDRMSADEALSFPPVIVYTGRSLDRADELKLRRYAASIIIKGARSPERLLDEVTLFLHQVEASLPQEKQRMLREVRNREAVFEGRRILLAEDDVRNVFALASMLEPKGAKLEIARNGREALEALDRASRAGAPAIDLVLMDIMMPEMDGLTATREIRKRPEWRKLPIIALTAKAMRDDREKCLEAGANDYIAKPLEVEKLLSLLRVWMPK